MITIVRYQQPNLADTRVLNTSSKDKRGKKRFVALLKGPDFFLCRLIDRKT